MKAITRRVISLEKRFGPPVETEFSRQLVARMEAGRRRLVEAGYDPAPADVQPQPGIGIGRRLDIVARLNAGRERSRLRAIQEERDKSGGIAAD